MEQITGLYSIYTDEVSELKKIFENSIKDDWSIYLLYLGEAGTGSGNFSTPGWYSVIRKKILFLIEQIKKNYGNIIIWSDIDVKFYSSCSDIIYSYMSHNDIVFQAERWLSKDVNTGFMAIRCNESTLALFELVLLYDLDKLPLADQSAMSDILGGKKISIKWDVLPRQFWAASHYYHGSFMPSRDVVLHHANCTMPIVRNNFVIGSVQLKLEQIQFIDEYISKRIK